MNKIALFATVLLLAACGTKQPAAKVLPDAGEAIPVKVSPVLAVEQSPVILATGLLYTDEEARYAFKIGGVIDKIAVKEGQHFKKGQLLAALLLTEIEAQHSQARLGFEKAKRDFDRVQKLYRDSVATLEQLQNTETALEVARKTVETVAFNQQYAKIYAASDGFVLKKLANEGEVIAGGMPVLAISEQSGQQDWLLKAGVTDREWAAIQTGQKASVRLDAFTDTFPAVVFRKSQAADQTSGSFTVELQVSLRGKQPAVGMFGRAEIITGASNRLQSIPYDALIEAEGQQAFVFAALPDNKVKKVPVRIAAFDRQQVYISAGLEGISSIVVSNSAFLNEASTIRIVQ